jgi:hypothetical protein
MPLQKIQLRPGINRDTTNYSNEGGWYECDKIRFFSGFPQKTWRLGQNESIEFYRRLPAALELDHLVLR